MPCLLFVFIRLAFVTCNVEPDWTFITPWSILLVIVPFFTSKNLILESIALPELTVNVLLFKSNTISLLPLLLDVSVKSILADEKSLNTLIVVLLVVVILLNAAANDV